MCALWVSRDGSQAQCMWYIPVENPSVALSMPLWQSCMLNVGGGSADKSNGPCHACMRGDVWCGLLFVVWRSHKQ